MAAAAAAERRALLIVPALFGRQVGMVDGQGFLHAALKVIGGNFQDAVGVDEKRHADAGAGGLVLMDARKREAAQAAAIGGFFGLALEDVHVDEGLVVLGRGEHFWTRMGMVLFFSMMTLMRSPRTSMPSV